jgi:hypothetical protein
MLGEPAERAREKISQRPILAGKTVDPFAEEVCQDRETRDPAPSPRNLCCHRGSQHVPRHCPPSCCAAVFRVVFQAGMVWTESNSALTMVDAAPDRPLLLPFAICIAWFRRGWLLFALALTHFLKRSANHLDAASLLPGEAVSVCHCGPYDADAAVASMGTANTRTSTFQATSRNLQLGPHHLLLHHPFLPRNGCFHPRFD